MIEIVYCENDERFTFTWWDEAVVGNDGPITEQIVALMMGWA